MLTSRQCDGETFGKRVRRTIRGGAVLRYSVVQSEDLLRIGDVERSKLKLLNLWIKYSLTPANIWLLSPVGMSTISIHSWVNQATVVMSISSDLQ